MVHKDIRGDKTEEEVFVAEEDDSQPSSFIQIPLGIGNRAEKELLEIKGKAQQKRQVIIIHCFNIEQI